ncbi:hypothetical protein P692DRAFT_20744765 [Suillus brevipes Sb2]|nr:hypothetical protein P692DRAFT_20744765 [Suillus brevipes Sb2]
MTSFSLHFLWSQSSHLQAGSYVPFESSSNFALDADLPSGLPCLKLNTHLPWTLGFGIKLFDKLLACFLAGWLLGNY